MAEKLIAGVLLACTGAVGGQLVSCDGKGAPDRGAATSVPVPAVSASGPGRAPPASAIDRDRAGRVDLARDASYTLVLQLPEWKARAAETATVPGDTLGSTCEDEPRPARCDPNQAPCRFSCEAIRVCGSGACAGGRWLGFEVDPWRQTVFIEETTTSEYVPYGRWRNRFRAEAREAGGPAYRPLLSPAQAFPDHQPGLGEFGYGSPSKVSTRASSTLSALMLRGGYRLIRTETYGPHAFNVYVLQRIAARRSDQDRRAFRGWGAQLVRANGDRTCEVAIVDAENQPTERFQFDGLVLEPGEGGMYAFVDEAFQPRLTTDLTNEK
jgi:hypothetical protein